MSKVAASNSDLSSVKLAIPDRCAADWKKFFRGALYERRGLLCIFMQKKDGFDGHLLPLMHKFKPRDSESNTHDPFHAHPWLEQLILAAMDNDGDSSVNVMNRKTDLTTVETNEVSEVK